MDEVLVCPIFIHKKPYDVGTMILYKTSLQYLAIFLLAAYPALFSTDLLACSKHGTNAGAELISIYGQANDSGQIEIRLGVESTLVAPITVATCVAGMGLGSADSPLPTGIQVIDIQIELVDRLTGRATPIPAFNFAADRETSTGLAAGSGGSAPGDPNPTIPGADWFGFSSEVQPFLHEPGPNEFVRMMFVVDMPVSLLPLLTKVQIAAGEGNSDGSPVFYGEHPVSYFTGIDNDLLLPDWVFADGFED